MLQINDLKLIHDKDYRVLIDGLSFAVNPGDKIVIIGEEGEGKSTLLKWIYDPGLIADYAEARGSRTIRNEKLAYLSQELTREQKNLSVYEFMSEEPRFLEATPRELALLSKTLGIPGDMYYASQKMGTLSGGERIKVQLARILVSNPSVLLLDEPSNDIDIETLEWLEDFINKRKEGILFVSHDETLIERTANRVIHIEQLNHKTLPRHTVANMPYREYVEKRLHSFELQESQAKLERREQEAAEEKWRRIYQKVERDQRNISRRDPSGGRLLKKKMHAVQSQGRRLDKQRETMTDYPHYEREINLMFGYEPEIHAGKQVLDLKLDRLTTEDQGKLLSKDVVLQVYSSDKICIIGKNGTGKTTLLKVIRDRIQKRHGISLAYMPQDYEEVLPMYKTPEEYLTKDGSKEESVLIYNRLASLRFTPDDMKRRIGELSSGQKGKLILLSLTLSGADVLLLDEPTRNFSPLSGPVVRAMLAGFGGAMISVSHDRKYIREVADKVYRLDEDGLEETQI